MKIFFILIALALPLGCENSKRSPAPKIEQISLPEEPRSFSSPDGSVILRIVPGENREPSASLHSLSSGNFARVAEFDLVQKRIPVVAVVNNSGTRLATFDQWHEMGAKQNVIVIYNGAGQLLKSFGFDDVMRPIRGLDRGSFRMIGKSTIWRSDAIFVPGSDRFVRILVTPRTSENQWLFLDIEDLRLLSHEEYLRIVNDN